MGCALCVNSALVNSGSVVKATTSTGVGLWCNYAKHYKWPRCLVRNGRRACSNAFS